MNRVYWTSSAQAGDATVRGAAVSETQAGKEDLRDARVGRVLNEYLDRRARGEGEPQAELLARHPDLADHLRLHLDMLRELAPSSSKIDALVSQGILKKASDPKYAAELGPYRIQAWIGRGGMGVVLKAWEESLNRTVALKILRPELVEDEAALARFTREAKTAAGLRHLNIITVYAVGQEGGAHFFGHGVHRRTDARRRYPCRLVHPVSPRHT